MRVPPWCLPLLALAGCASSAPPLEPLASAPVRPAGVVQDGHGVYRLCVDCPGPTPKRLAAAPLPPLRLDAPKLPPEPPRPVEAVAREERLIVRFALASARLSEEAIQALEARRAVLLDAESITVTGMTDQVGGRHFNARLAQRRAEAARAALLRIGVAEGRITIATHCCAEAPPVVNPPARRAELLIQTRKVHG